MDPYNILGVDKNSTKEEIKEAYESILNEYSLGNSPIDNRPLSEEIIMEANLAYDALVTGKIYKEIRSYIDSNNIALAESKLNILDLKDSAEWNYLMGFVCFKKGWFDVGIKHILISTEIEPNNEEYNNTLKTLRERSKDIINYYKKINTSGNVPNNMNMCGNSNNSGNKNGGMC